MFDEPFQSFMQQNNMFPDPYLDYTNRMLPRTLQGVLQWAESAWVHNGEYRQAVHKIISFFLTEIEYRDIDHEEIENIKELHDRKLKTMDQLLLLGKDRQCYGNSFSVIYVPVIRMLRCPRCRRLAPVSQWKYKFQDFEFWGTADCNGNGGKCNYRGRMDRLEWRSFDDEKIQVIRLNPHYIQIVFNAMTRETKYLYNIPPQIKAAVRAGDAIYVETLPWEMIEAIQQNSYFEFAPKVLYHMKEDTLAGIVNAGWGLPPVLTNLRLIHHLQVLRKHDEAIALDYIIPFRAITPVPIGQTDPLKMHSMNTFRSNVHNMVQRHRQDPAAWFVLPFPIDYKVYGGEGRELVPVELQTMAVDSLLNAIGCPAELYRGTLTVQGAPMSLRLFMQIWRPWISDINGWLDWANGTICSAMQWDKPNCNMKPSTLADDMERRSIELQLAASNRIALGTALDPLSIDFKREVDRRYEEQKYEMQKQREFEKDMQSQQLQGMVSGTAPSSMGGPAGAAGGATGGALAGMSPSDIKQQAMEQAQQLVQMPYAQRRQQLNSLKQTSETLYALTKSEMEKLRTQAESAGRQQLSAT